MAKQLYTIDLASSRGGGDSLGSAFPLLVPRVISRVIFALFSRYFCVIFPHVCVIARLYRIDFFCACLMKDVDRCTAFVRAVALYGKQDFTAENAFYSWPIGWNAHFSKAFLECASNWSLGWIQQTQSSF